MCKHIFIGTVILIAAIGPLRLQAQDSTQTKPVQQWSLKGCLDYARQNNITLNTLRLTSASSEQSLIQAKAAKTPSLSGTVSQSLANYKSGLSAGSSYGVSSSVTLYNGNYLNNDIKEKQLSLQIANLNILSSENDITLQITQAYLNILLAKENIVYLQDVVNTIHAQVEQGQQRVKAGTIAEKDLLELQATEATDKYNLVSAQNTQRQYLINLKQILQLPFDSTFDIIYTTVSNDNLVITPLEEAQRLALQNRPEIKSSALNVDIGQIGIEKAKTGLKPTLSLGGSINTSYAKSPGSTYFTQLGDNFYQQLGVTLSIPIIDKKVTKTNVEKAKIATAQAKLSLQNTQTTLSQTVEQAYINVLNAQSQYTAANEQLRYAKESYRIAGEQLKIGTYNTVEFLQQKNQYVQSLQTYIQSKYSTILYNKIYNFYIGIPVTQ
jgi:Outer membrane protein